VVEDVEHPKQGLVPIIPLQCDTGYSNGKHSGHDTDCQVNIAHFTK